jgi:hypothetical protein
MSENEELDEKALEGLQARAKEREQERRKRETLLLANIKARLPDLETLGSKVEDHWAMEDGFYRFYHQSFKVYGVQNLTQELVRTFEELLPGAPLNTWFLQIVTEGTGKEFKDEDNENWLAVNRVILEALFHAHYFLAMICKYGRELKAPPSALPSGWAAVLYLYNLR